MKRGARRKRQQNPVLIRFKSKQTCRPSVLLFVQHDRALNLQEYFINKLSRLAIKVFDISRLPTPDQVQKFLLSNEVFWLSKLILFFNYMAFKRRGFFFRSKQNAYSMIVGGVDY